MWRAGGGGGADGGGGAVAAHHGINLFTDLTKRVIAKVDKNHVSHEAEIQTKKNKL